MLASLVGEAALMIVVACLGNIVVIQNRSISSVVFVALDCFGFHQRSINMLNRMGLLLPELDQLGIRTSELLCRQRGH